MVKGASGLVTEFALGAAGCDAEVVGGCTELERYVFARILATVMNEAGRALEEGVASAEDIDTAMVLGTNYPRGPLGWAAEVGHATVGGVLAELDRSSEDGRFAAAAVFSSGPEA